MKLDRRRQFRWLERGTGEPVVLLHGLMSRMDHWEATLERLAPACRAIAPELPIFAPWLPEASIAELARQVRDFLDALDIPAAVVGGNSLGGHVALELALVSPERVTGLVLAGSSGLFERTFTRGVARHPSPELVRQKMEEVFHDPGMVTESWVRSVREVVSTPGPALRVVRFARAARRENLRDRLQEIGAPTLLVWGAHDRITPPPVAEEFRRLIAGAELSFIQGCGHAPMIERPEAFAAIVADWLERTRPRRRMGALVEGWR